MLFIKKETKKDPGNRFVGWGTPKTFEQAKRKKNKLVFDCFWTAATNSIPVAIMWYLQTSETSFLPWVPCRFISRAAAVYIAKPDQFWGQKRPRQREARRNDCFRWLAYALFCDIVGRFCIFAQTFGLAAQIASVRSKIEKYYLQI